MFGFLVRDENLEIVKIALAVIAPRPIQQLVQRRATSFLAHCGVRMSQNLKPLAQ